jgi:uncharacterized protein
MRPRAILYYCLATCGLGWAIQFTAIARVGDLESPAAGPWLATTMFTPMLGALLLLVFHRPARAHFAWRPRWTLIPTAFVAVLVPTLIAFGAVAVTEAAGWGRSGWFRFSSAGVAISGGPWTLGRGEQGWPLFAANVLLTGIRFAALNSVVAIGEEFGWRGLLQGHLTARYGTSRGILLVTLAWSAWHLPSLLHGYNYPEHPVFGALVLFPLILVGESFFLGWLTIRAGSFWPAVLGHAAGNSIEEGVIRNLHLEVPQLHADLLRVALTLLCGAVFWVLLARGDRRRCSPAIPVTNQPTPPGVR